MSLRLSGGRRLQSPPGDIARPTPSRVRLALMNMLQRELPGCSWLDLCCGSGVMACEAIQRGAQRIVAVDQDRRLVTTARTNLELVAASRTPAPEVTVVQQDVLRWLRSGKGTHHQGFELIYADPPYRAGLYQPLMEAVMSGDWLRPEGRLLLECATNEVPQVVPGWQLLQERRYGSTTVLVLNRP